MKATDFIKKKYDIISKKSIDDIEAIQQLSIKEVVTLMEEYANYEQRLNQPNQSFRPENFKPFTKEEHEQAGKVLHKGRSRAVELLVNEIRYFDEPQHYIQGFIEEILDEYNGTELRGKIFKKLKALVEREINGEVLEVGFEVDEEFQEIMDYLKEATQEVQVVSTAKERARIKILIAQTYLKKIEVENAYYKEVGKGFNN